MSMKKVEKRKEKREGLIMSKLNLEKERIRRRRRKQKFIAFLIIIF